MPKYTIRKALRSDLAALLVLESVAFRSDRLSRRSFRRAIGSASALLRVAVTERRLAGYYLTFFRANATAARLYSIAVDPGRRGQGLAALLLNDAERQSALRGRRSLRLEAREDNGPAIRLYERLGFRRIGARSDYYADGATALRYEKRLAPRRPRLSAAAAG